MSTPLSTRNAYGRACLVCSHSDADTLDALIAGGASVADLSRRFGVSRDSIYRHTTWHLRPALAEAVKRSPEVRPVALVERIAAIANDARDARLSAYAAGNAWLGARLGEAEMRALVALADRLGIEHDDAASDARDSASIARVLGDVARTLPGIAEALADAFDRDARSDLADEIRAQGAQARALTILETTPTRLEALA
jgi:hypothetical protein